MRDSVAYGHRDVCVRRVVDYSSLVFPFFHGSRVVHVKAPPIFIIIIRYVCLLSQAFLPGTSLEPAVIPTAQASSFTLQYFPYYV